MKARALVRVLVVDDEVPLLDEMRLFAWHTHDCVLIDAVRSGREALDILSEHPCDILITDISMPGMDGIELARRVSSDYPHVQIIFLTLHREFDYARSALRFGVAEYLLKGINEESDLVAALDLARDRLAADGIQDSREDQAFQLMLNGKRASLSMLHFPFRLGVVLVSASGPIPVELAAMLRSSLRVVGALRRVTDTTFYVDARSTIPKGQLECRLIESVKGVEERFSEFDLKLRVAIGPLVSNPDQLRAVHVQAQRTAASAFYGPRRVTLDWRDSPWNALSEANALELTVALYDAVPDSSAIRTHMKKTVTRTLRSSDIDPSDAVALLSRWAKEIGDGELPGEAARELDELAEAVVSSIERATDNRRRCGRSEVEHAIRYVKQNLRRAVTLYETARHVGLSPNYLGALFRQNVGHGFKWYQNRIRVERAAELLRSSNLKVYEVSDEVGIANYRHFTHLFREHFGVSPRDYRSASSDGPLGARG